MISNEPQFDSSIMLDTNLGDEIDVDFKSFINFKKRRRNQSTTSIDNTRLKFFEA